MEDRTLALLRVEQHSESQNPVKRVFRECQAGI
nr:MAG TPA: hypothetical protein [Caudoviricetes sp.]